MYSLWLRDELFLLGHDEAGKPVVHEAILAAGLAGAMLLDLVFAGGFVRAGIGDAGRGRRDVFLAAFAEKTFSGKEW